MRRAIAALLWLMPIAARAEFLPAESREISLANSASRDTPILELAYGPLMQGSLGGEFGIYRMAGKRLDLHVSVFGLAAFENGTSQLPLPFETVRLTFGATVSFAPTALHRPDGTVWEFSAGLVREQSSLLNGYVLPDPVLPSDIPFGGGGTYIDLVAAWRHPVGAWEFILDFDYRIHIAELFDWIDLPVIADFLADISSDAAMQVPALDATIRWRVSPRWQPVLAVHGEVMIPAGPFAFGGYGRAILGVAFPGRLGELIPFVSGEVGNGMGLLINRHQLQIAGGIRYVP